MKQNKLLLKIVQEIRIPRELARIGAAVALGLLCSGNAMYPQQLKRAPEKTCVPSQVAGLFVREGRAVRVNQVQERSRNTSGSRENDKAISIAEGITYGETILEARKLFVRAARQGYAAAQVNLGVISLGGWGEPADTGAALYWFHAAAEQGFAPAFYDLGVMYMNGCGVRQDYSEAFHYFEKGAEKGDPAAEMNLGYLYDHGLGIAQDRKLAAFWYGKAAESGEPQAQYNLGDLYAQGDGVALDEPTAFAWFQKAAVQGHSGARILLGYMFAQGKGTKKDLASAYVWIAAAALQGDSRGQSILATLESQLGHEQLAEAREQAQFLAKSDKKSVELAFIH